MCIHLYLTRDQVPPEFLNNPEIKYIIIDELPEGPEKDYYMRIWEWQPTD